MAFELRWGIIATGKISTVVTKDLLLDPKTRDVHDIVHKVVAVGSRSVDSAQKFIDTVASSDKSIKAYGSYDDVFADSNVTAVYIGTPHTYHFDNALAAIKAGKHVLCEKPVTTNSSELHALLEAAKEKNVFFMEAMWTRFQPLPNEVLKLMREEKEELGEVAIVHADLSGDFDIENLPKTHRILDPELGGGGLLDLGPYPMVWATMTLFEHPSNKLSPPSHISASMLKTPLTNVDSNTSWSLTFPSIKSSPASGGAQAILSTSINLNAPPASSMPGVTIRFEKGTISIPAPIYCPKSYKVQYTDKSGKVKKEEGKEFSYIGGGWHWQADEVARCVKEGKNESELWGWGKSVFEMGVFDEVRKQGGLVYPPGVEKVGRVE